jgi:MFS transporter, DHA1 family, inner membrane transport protein
MQKSDKKTLTIIILFTLVRLLDSTVFRMVSPFLPALANGMGVPIESVALAASARSACGIFGLPLGAVADVRGRKQALVGALLVFGISMIMIGQFPSFTLFFIGLVLSGGATIVIDSSIHAYLGDRIPYAQRGRATATVELGWSLAFLIAIPLMGWSMAVKGWNAPFTWLGIAGLLAAGIIGLVLPRTNAISGSWETLKSGLRKVLAPTPLSGLLLAMLMTLGNQIIFIVFGIWMQDAFGLNLEQTGLSSIVIGLGGLAGVGCAVLFTDKLGKRKSIGMGIAVNSVICLIFPVLQNQLWIALIVLFMFYLSFEFALTSLLPLMTTLSTQARGVYMAATLAALSLGDALGILVGPVLIHGGLAANSITTLAINLVGLLLLLIFVRPMDTDQQVVEQLGEIFE